MSGHEVIGAVVELSRAETIELCTELAAACGSRLGAVGMTRRRPLA